VTEQRALNLLVVACTVVCTVPTVLGLLDRWRAAHPTTVPLHAVGTPPGQVLPSAWLREIYDDLR